MDALPFTLFTVVLLGCAMLWWANQTPPTSGGLSA